jgi:hypothetical protein
MSMINIKYLFGEEVSLMMKKQIKKLLILNNLYKKSWNLIGAAKTQKTNSILLLSMNIQEGKQMNSMNFFDVIYI